jgi:hypothetical protein
VPKPYGGVQGEQYVGINCHATLPEIGETSQSSGIRVFVNDINVKLDASSKGNKGVINAELNKIVLDRINNGTAKDDSDYLGEAVPGKGVQVTVYKNMFTPQLPCQVPRSGCPSWAETLTAIKTAAAATTRLR